MAILDADTHVHECLATWDYLDKEFHPRRPQVVTLEHDSAYGDFDALWLIDGRLLPKPVGRGAIRFRTPVESTAASKTWAPIGCQTLEDVPGRLAAMKEQGVDFQVVFPTLFLAPIAEDPDYEAALCRAYNRFMSEAAKKSAGRIRFVATLPWRSTEHAISVLREAKQLGAVAAWLPGLLWDRPLGDAGLFPLYGEFEAQELPLCLHFGWGSPAILNMYSSNESQFFPAGVLPVVMGFESLLASGVLDRYRGLRIATVEAGCEWVPWVVHQLERRHHSTPHLLGGTRRPAQYLEDGQVYLTCETHEDIRPLFEYLDESRLMVGSDYPHSDPSHEKELVKSVASWEGVTESTKEKMLKNNAAVFYGMPEALGEPS